MLQRSDNGVFDHIVGKINVKSVFEEIHERLEPAAVSPDINILFSRGDDASLTMRRL